MSAIILDLQRAALDSQLRTSDLLRTVLTVAIKLDNSALRDWSNRELRGYGPDDTVPLYRRVRGLLKAHNPYRGWIPVIMEDTALQDRLSQRDIGQAIAQLEALDEDRDEGSLQVPIPHEWLLKVFGATEAFQLGVVPTLLVSRSQVHGILDAVRNVALQWSLTLEREDILGEGMRFTREELARAQTISFDVERLGRSD